MPKLVVNVHAGGGWWGPDYGVCHPPPDVAAEITNPACWGPDDGDDVDDFDGVVVELPMSPEAVMSALIGSPVADGLGLVEVGEQPPVDGSITDILTRSVGDVVEWVGDDPERARAALAAETGARRPRSTLVAHLEVVAAGGPEAA